MLHQFNAEIIQINLFLVPSVTSHYSGHTTGERDHCSSVSPDHNENKQQQLHYSGSNSYTATQTQRVPPPAYRGIINSLQDFILLFHILNSQ